MMLPQITINALLDFKDIDNKFMADLMEFAPFGPENLNPIFATKDVMDYGTSKLVGKELEHIKLEMIDKTSAQLLHGIAFRQKPKFGMIKDGHFEICYTLEENTHNGKTNTQLYIKDIGKKQLP